MSLILGITNGTRGGLYADTLLTRSGSTGAGRPVDLPLTPSELSHHGLKVHILSRELCIGFAGIFDLGIRTISNIHKLRRKGPVSDSAKALQEVYISCRKSFGLHAECDFLLLGLGCKGIELIRVNATSILSTKDAWIGDADAYEELRKLRGSICLPEAGMLSEFDTKAFEITNALSALCSSRKTSTVGSFGDQIARVSYDPKLGFEYLTTSTVAVSGSEKSAYATLASDCGYPHGIAFYFHSASKGFLFISADPKSPYSIVGDDIERFRDRAWVLKGIIYCRGMRAETRRISLLRVVRGIYAWLYFRLHGIRIPTWPLPWDKRFGSAVNRP